MLINKERLMERLNTLAEYGKNVHGGMDRPFGSEADINARKWLIYLWGKQLNFKVKIDAIGNLWAGLAGTENLPALVLGSHHDTVANGGKYDGALGVILATEVLNIIKENNYKLRHPLKLVSFTAEEPNMFNLSTLGSRVASGKLIKDDIKGAKGDYGITLGEALKKVGGSIENLQDAKISKEDMSAFIECHIEQGRRLFDKNLSLAVVPKVTGIYREKVKIIGEPNHAGTTVMSCRHDALIAASQLCLEFEKIIKDIHRDDVVGTVGHIEVKPNSINIIPGEVDTILEFRTPDFNDVEIIYANINNAISFIENKRGVKIISETMLKQREVIMDKAIISTLKRAMTKMDETNIELVSMAGHDAVHMSSLTKTAMLFVASVNGKSHCADEFTEEMDIIKAANVLLETILILDKELD
ncbi:Zn-dependent hydrolase [Clostridium akagii]|uniref:Zn-dependent hydrolase n=1 Tax=Clostridium akagii TaxID=91623 RepID=UPI00047AFE97|nr:Zn-dependent hydrolase [Clostridium akagii]